MYIHTPQTRIPFEALSLTELGASDPRAFHPNVTTLFTYATTKVAEERSPLEIFRGRRARVAQLASIRRGQSVSSRRRIDFFRVVVGLDRISSGIGVVGARRHLVTNYSR